MAMSGRLGSMLVSSGLITDDQLKKALSTQKLEGGRLNHHRSRWDTSRKTS
jgi:hypothetical protein